MPKYQAGRLPPFPSGQKAVCLNSESESAVWLYCHFGRGRGGKVIRLHPVQISLRGSYLRINKYSIPIQDLIYLTP